MTKRIEIDGKFYRQRRGKLVEIPAEWVGKTPTQQTINKRPSKLVGKVKRVVKDITGLTRYKDRRDAAHDEHE